jgi:hypothetical protein
VGFAAITLCVASQLVLVFYFVMTQSGNFWIYPRSASANREGRQSESRSDILTESFHTFLEQSG